MPIHDKIEADAEIGQSIFYGNTFSIRTHAILTHEDTGYNIMDDFITTSKKITRRIYIYADFYILIPRLVYEMGQPDHQGEVISESYWSGMDHHVIGDGQAWFYPETGHLILWDCVLSESHRTTSNPSEDDGLLTLWKSFERFLTHTFGDIKEISTPSLEPIEKTRISEESFKQWLEFLSKMGYNRVSKQVFSKLV